MKTYSPISVDLKEKRKIIFFFLSLSLSSLSLSLSTVSLSFLLTFLLFIFFFLFPFIFFYFYFFSSFFSFFFVLSFSLFPPLDTCFNMSHSHKCTTCHAMCHPTPDVSKNVKFRLSRNPTKFDWLTRFRETNSTVKSVSSSNI